MTMSLGYELVPFSDFLERVERKVMVENDKFYQMVGVRWYGRGTFIRETRQGADIARKQQWIVRNGDIVYNKLFAWKGAFAIAENVDGCIVSDKFPTYIQKTDRVDMRYLGYFFLTSYIAKQSYALSRGAASISKFTLNPPDFWKLGIPLPPIEEQRRIAARVDNLVSRAKHALAMKKEAIQRASKLMGHIREKVFAKVMASNSTARVRMSNLIAKSSQVPSLDPSYADMPYLSLKNIEAHSGRIIDYRSVADTGIKGKVVLFDERYVLYSKLRPYLNKVAVPDFKGCGSTELVLLEPDGKSLMRCYLAEYLRNPDFVAGVNANSTGTRMPRTNMVQFRKEEIPVPSLDVQAHICNRFRVLQQKIGDLERLQEKTQVELESLIASIIEMAFRRSF